MNRTLVSFYTDQLENLPTYCREEYVEEIRGARLQDPPTIKQKGRPRSQRLTGALEGRARGGGGSILRSRQAATGSGAANRLCGVCRMSGHNRTTCPLNQ
jgi:hypothetical protein